MEIDGRQVGVLSHSLIAACLRAFTACGLVLWSIIQYGISGFIFVWPFYLTHWTMVMVAIYLLYTIALIDMDHARIVDSLKRAEAGATNLSSITVETPAQAAVVYGQAEPHTAAVPEPQSICERVFENECYSRETMLRGIAFPGAILVCSLYWIIPHQWRLGFGSNLVVIAEHTIPLLLMLFDARTHRPKSNLPAMILAFEGFLVLYVIWTGVFERFHLRDENDHPYIYSIIQWRLHPGYTLFYIVLGLLVFAPSATWLAHLITRTAKDALEAYNNKLP
jgi:hypothetical protein